MKIFKGKWFLILFPIVLLFFKTPDLTRITFIKGIVVLLITFFTDNIKIEYKKFRLITNAIGFLIAFYFGIEYIIIASIAVFFRISKGTLWIRTRKALIYFIMYYLSAIFSFMITKNIYLELFLFLSFAILINQLFFDLNKFNLRIFGIEYAYFLSLLPAMYVQLFNQSIVLKAFIIFQNVIYLSFYYFIIRLKNEKIVEDYKNERIKKFNKVLVEYSKLLNTTKKNIEEIFCETAKIINEVFGYKYILFSKMNYETGLIDRISHYGIPEDYYEKIKSKKVPIKNLKKIMDDKYKYENSYFIPSTKDILIKENSYLFDIEQVKHEFKKETKWNYKDLLIVSINDDCGRVWGYLSCDMPRDERRPTKEDLEMLSVLGGILSIIISNRKKYNHVKSLSEKDGLTGAYNFLKIVDDMNNNIEKVFSVAFFDMDNFKRINDKYGHLYGDEVLKNIVKVIKENIRSSDSVYRYGGDEFVVIFKGLNKYKASNIVKRIQHGLVKLHEGTTFSVGIADSSEAKLKELIELADKRAYYAKRKGKNRIIYKKA